MLELFRRFVILHALMLWQGGFLFYTSVVVPLGTRELGGPAEQGRITRHVTDYMNAIGIGTLLLLVWDQIRTQQPSTRSWRWGMWLVMSLTMIGMILLHPYLEQIMDEYQLSEQRPLFRYYHRTYLWLSTFQWLASVLYIALMLKDWTTKNQDLHHQ